MKKKHIFLIFLMKGLLRWVMQETTRELQIPNISQFRCSTRFCLFSKYLREFGENINEQSVTGENV